MDMISVHVPKTAGSSFGKLLGKVYGESGIFLDYDDVPMNPLSRYHFDREGWRASIRVGSIDPGFRAIHGHFAVEKYEGAFPETPRIAWVRHPAAWVISLYYFWKHVPTTSHPLVRRLHSEGLTLEEFARDPNVRNRVSGIFLKGMPPEGFAFLGIQEHFDADLRDLTRFMGWPEVDSCSENRNVEPRYTDRIRDHLADDRLVDRLISWNEGDMTLYKKAVRLRAERLERSRVRAEQHARRQAIRARSNGDRDEGLSEVA